MKEIEWERLLFSKKRVLEAKNQRIGYWQYSGSPRHKLEAEFLGRNLAIRNYGRFSRKRTQIIDPESGTILATATYKNRLRSTAVIKSETGTYEWQYNHIFSSQWSLTDASGKAVINGNSNMLKGVVTIDEITAPELILSLTVSEYARDSNTFMAAIIAVPQVIFFLGKLI